MSNSAYRPRGTGHVFPRGNTWYGEFYVRGRKVKRSLGSVRQAGSRVGLSRTMAEAKLREKMAELAHAPPVVEGRMTVADVGARRIRSLARKGRQPDTTLANYEADIRLHFAPFFESTPVDRITIEDVEEFLDHCLDGEFRMERGQRPLSIATVAKLYPHLSGTFEFAIRKRWCHANPCKEVDKPASADAEQDPEIRFLTMEELEALLVVAGTGPCKHTPNRFVHYDVDETTDEDREHTEQARSRPGLEYARASLDAGLWARRTGPARDACSRLLTRGSCCPRSCSRSVCWRF